MIHRWVIHVLGRHLLGIHGRLLRWRTHRLIAVPNIGWHWGRCSKVLEWFRLRIPWEGRNLKGRKLLLPSLRCLVSMLHKI